MDVKNESQRKLELVQDFAKKWMPMRMGVALLCLIEETHKPEELAKLFATEEIWRGKDG